MREAPITAVLFDLDGTLIDTAPEFIAVVHRLRAELGKPPLSDETIRRSVSNGSAGLVTSALDCPPEHAEYEGLRSRFLDFYEEHLGDNSSPYPGIRELTDLLAQRGLPWGVVTNKFRRFAEPLMNLMDFAAPPKCLVTPCDVALPKPDPESIVLACTQLGVSPDQALYVGDHIRDIQAGRGAGCVTAAAAYGYIETGDDPYSWDADMVVDSSEQLHQIVMELLV